VLISGEVNPGYRLRQDLTTPGLSNVAATILNLLGFEAPADYDASLIEPE
jgi:2,3-bisphosphoglycerate-independent phosphoglycerate mutase